MKCPILSWWCWNSNPLHFHQHIINLHSILIRIGNENTDWFFFIFFFQWFLYSIFTFKRVYRLISNVFFFLDVLAFCAWHPHISDFLPSSSLFFVSLFFILYEVLSKKYNILCNLFSLNLLFFLLQIVMFCFIQFNVFTTYVIYVLQIYIYTHKFI